MKHTSLCFIYYVLADSMFSFVDMKLLIVFFVHSFHVSGLHGRRESKQQSGSTVDILTGQGFKILTVSDLVPAPQENFVLFAPPIASKISF